MFHRVRIKLFHESAFADMDAYPSGLLNPFTQQDEYGPRGSPLCLFALCGQVEHEGMPMVAQDGDGWEAADRPLTPSVPPPPSISGPAPATGMATTTAPAIEAPDGGVRGDDTVGRKRRNMSLAKWLPGRQRSPSKKGVGSQTNKE